MKELRKIPTEKLGCRKCHETFGRIYAVTATETDGNMKKKKQNKTKQNKKQTGCRTVCLRFCLKREQKNMFPVRNSTLPQLKDLITIAEIRDS